MKIALIQGFPYFHYEMLGYLIEYCIVTNIDFTIYTLINQISEEWKVYYESLFKRQLPWSIITSFAHQHYDYIIIATDDDICYLSTMKYFEPINTTKIVTIEHSPKIRTPPVYKRVCVRFNGRLDCEFALPVYYNINLQDKIKMLSEEPKINVTIVGATFPKSKEILQKLFTNYSEIQFNIITRVYKNELEGESNIKIFKNCNTSLMMDIVQKSEYILCCEENPKHCFEIMSGVIPLAFGSRCRLIIPKAWNEWYCLQTPIEYCSESKIQLLKEIDHDQIDKETYDLISKKNRIFDKIFDVKNNLKFATFYGRFFECKIFSKPNVFIDINNNFMNLLEIKKDFREIHTYNKNSFDNHFIYQYESNIKLNNILEKILEPVVVVFDFNNYKEEQTTLIDNLTILGTRFFNDYIIIDNIDDNNELFIKLGKAVKKPIFKKYILNKLFIINQNIC